MSYNSFTVKIFTQKMKCFTVKTNYCSKLYISFLLWPNSKSKLILSRICKLNQTFDKFVCSWSSEVNLELCSKFLVQWEQIHTSHNAIWNVMVIVLLILFSQTRSIQDLQPGRKTAKDVHYKFTRWRTHTNCGTLELLDTWQLYFTDQISSA